VHAPVSGAWRVRVVNWGVSLYTENEWLKVIIMRGHIAIDCTSAAIVLTAPKSAYHSMCIAWDIQGDAKTKSIINVSSKIHGGHTTLTWNHYWVPLYKASTHTHDTCYISSVRLTFCPSVCLFVCLSHLWTVSTLLVALLSFLFSVIKFLDVQHRPSVEFDTNSLLTDAVARCELLTWLMRNRLFAVD